MSRVDRLSTGSNAVYLVSLKDDGKAVFKPASGETKLRRHVEPGTYWQREVCASEVAEVVGMKDMVPATVSREIKIGNRKENGSLQEFVEGKVGANLVAGRFGRKDKDRTDLCKAAAFDYVMGNTDRHGGNWLVTESGGLKLIDNGLSLPEGMALAEENRLRFLGFVYEASFSKAPIPSSVRSMWKGKWKAVSGKMSANGISSKAISAAKNRYDNLMNKKFVTFKQLADNPLPVD